MRGKLSLHIDLTIKFQAFGMTFANVAEHLVFPFPDAVQPLGQLVGNVLIGRYNDHGVSLIASIVHDAPPPVPEG